jgi:hypothetical protein
MSLQPGNIAFDEGLTQASNLNRTIDSSTEPDEPRTGPGIWIYLFWGGLFLCLSMCCIKMMSTQEEKEIPPGEVRRKHLTDQFVKSGNQMVRVENRRGYSEESNLLTRPPLLLDAY